MDENDQLIAFITYQEKLAQDCEDYIRLIAQGRLDLCTMAEAVDVILRQNVTMARSLTVMTQVLAQHLPPNA